MDLERACRLIHGDDVQAVEPFVVPGWFEFLPRGEDGDVGHACPPLAQPVSPERVLRIGWKEVTHHLRAVAAGERNQRRPDGGAGIGIVDRHRSARGQCVGDQLLLPPLRAAIVAHDVFADMIVGGGETLAIERRLAGSRQPDQDDALHWVLKIALLSSTG